MQPGVDLRGERISRVRHGADQQLVEHAPQRIDVAPAVQRPALDLLGSRVVDRRHHSAGRGQRGRLGLHLAHGLGHAEVGQENAFRLVLTALGEQNVGGFHIPMDQLSTVREIQCSGYLFDDVDGTFLWHAVRVLGQCPVGGGAVDEPHAQPELSVLGAAVVDRHDVRVIELGDGVCLPFEPTHEGRVRAQVGAEQFQRDVPGQPGMTGEVDDAHSTGAQLALNGEPGEHRARLERHARHSASTNGRWWPFRVMVGRIGPIVQHEGAGRRVASYHSELDNAATNTKEFRMEWEG